MKLIQKAPLIVDPETGEKRFKPEALQEMIDLGVAGKWTAAYAKHFKVSKSAIHMWRKRYPDFAEAYDIAMTAAQAWWEELGQTHAVTTTGQTFNAVVWHRTLAAHVKDEWMERRETTTRDGDKADLHAKTDAEVEAEIERLETMRAAREAAKDNAAAARRKAGRDAG